MKKNYTKLLLSILLLAGVSNALFADTEPDIVIKDMTPDGTGVIYESSSSYGITVRASNYQVKTVTLSVPCLQLNGDLPALTLINTGSPAYGYVDVITEGEEVIETIEYIGSASTIARESFAMSGVSLDGLEFPLNYLRDDRNIFDGDGFPESMSVAQVFSTNFTDACKGYTISIPEVAYQGELFDVPPRTKIEKFDEQVKVVRLLWGVSSFAGLSTSSPIGPSPELYGLKIYLKDKGFVGIEKDSGNPLELTQKGSEVTVNELSDFVVYNLSGMCVLNEKNTQELDLSVLSNGLYIVKAISNESGESGTLKVLLKK